MTDAAPKRIWAWPNQTPTGLTAWGSGCYRAEPRRPLDAKDGPTGTEYILASEVAALIREAKAWGMERVAARARVYASNYEQSSDGRNTFILLAERADAEAAAIRARKETP